MPKTLPEKRARPPVEGGKGGESKTEGDDKATTTNQQNKKDESATTNQLNKNEEEAKMSKKEQQGK